MTSSFTRLEKWWLSQIPIGSMLSWRPRCFHGHTSSPACSLHRDTTSRCTSHSAVHKPTHSIVLITVAMRRHTDALKLDLQPRVWRICQRTQGAEMKLEMWSAWHFYSRSFSSAYGSSLKSNLHKEPRSQRFSGVFCWASRELTLL